MRFKKIKRVFRYQPLSSRLPVSDRLVTHVVEHRHPTEIVIPTGISGCIWRVADLDTRGSYPLGVYFTTPVLAVEAFIARAEVALANTTLDAQDRKGWVTALATARRDLSSQIRSGRRVSKK